MEISSGNERVIVYVDGFNLYFGMIEHNYEKFRWLNLKKLMNNLLHPNQKLIEIKYFTSRVSNNPDKQKRQTTYIEALETEGIKIYYGRYQINNIECKRCGDIRQEPNEKMTDVNIATQMLTDAFQDRFDTSILISGDSDLVAPINAVHAHFNKKKVTVFFPPMRYNNSVAAVARGSLIIGRKKLADSQFDKDIKKADGWTLTRPSHWD